MDLKFTYNLRFGVLEDSEFWSVMIPTTLIALIALVTLISFGYLACRLWKKKK